MLSCALLYREKCAEFRVHFALAPDWRQLKSLCSGQRSARLAAARRLWGRTCAVSLRLRSQFHRPVHTFPDQRAFRRWIDRGCLSVRHVAPVPGCRLRVTGSGYQTRCSHCFPSADSEHMTTPGGIVCSPLAAWSVVACVPSHLKNLAEQGQCQHDILDAERKNPGPGAREREPARHTLIGVAQCE
jgi:hypothetical protein